MKKQVKKLALAKDTVRNLGELELAPVAGGWTERCASEELICKHPPSWDGC